MFIFLFISVLISVLIPVLIPVLISVFISVFILTVLCSHFCVHLCAHFDCALCSFLCSFPCLVAGLSGTPTYSIVGGDRGGVFRVEADTGVIRTALPLDREAQAYYTLSVMATDRAAPPSVRLSATTVVSTILSLPVH